MIGSGWLIGPGDVMKQVAGRPVGDVFRVKGAGAYGPSLAQSLCGTFVSCGRLSRPPPEGREPVSSTRLMGLAYAWIRGQSPFKFASEKISQVHHALADHILQMLLLQ
jgi:hypothetical protein